MGELVGGGEREGQLGNWVSGPGMDCSVGPLSCEDNSVPNRRALSRRSGLFLGGTAGEYEHNRFYRSPCFMGLGRGP